jgi:outer membrane protein
MTDRPLVIQEKVFVRYFPARGAIFCALLLGILAGDAKALTLEEAISTALSQNERGKSAAELAKAAGAQVGQARSFLFPNLTLLGDYTRRSHETTRTINGTTSVLQSRDATEVRLNLDQIIFDAQAWPLFKEARRIRDAAELDAVEAKRQLAFDTARSFFAVLTSEQVVRAAGERLSLAERNLEDARVRFDAQLVGSNDVTRAQLEKTSADRELVDAQGVARVARLTLGNLLGETVEDSLVVPEALLAEATRPVTQADVSAQVAMSSRPDVRAGKARVAALRAAAQEPLMRYLPDLSFHGTAWSTNESGFSNKQEDWSLGLGLTWDLFDGTERQAARSEASARARAAELDQTNLERSVATDLESARVGLETAQASLMQVNESVTVAERNAAEAAELYRRGLVRAFEVVDANVQTFTTQVERARSQFALALTFLNLRFALGLDPLGEVPAP